VLDSAKLKIFALMSVIIHVVFAVLFAQVTPSFQPPTLKRLSLTIMTREGAKGEIIRSEAAWPMPKRVEPGFAPDDALKDFGKEAAEWIEFRPPDPSLFEPKDTLSPGVNIRELAEKAYEPPANDFFSHPPPELKRMPVTDFALGPTAPDLLGAE
jgi:hypothetical protein